MGSGRRIPIIASGRQAAAQTPHTTDQRPLQDVTFRIADSFEHLALEIGHIHAAPLEQFVPAGGYLRPQDAPIARLQRAHDQLLLLQIGDDLHHRLRPNERAPRKLRIGQTTLELEYRERGVLRKSDSVLRHSLPHLDRQRSIESTDDVAEAGLGPHWPFWLWLVHGSHATGAETVVRATPGCRPRRSHATGRDIFTPERLSTAVAASRWNSQQY